MEVTKEHNEKRELKHTGEVDYLILRDKLQQAEKDWIRFLELLK